METNASLPGELIITGDLNFHIEKPEEDKSAHEFLDHIHSYNLNQLVKGITHINFCLMVVVVNDCLLHISMFYM